MAKKYRLVMTLTLLLVAMLVFPTIAQAATNTSPTAARNAALAELTRVVFNVGSDVYSVNGVNRTSDVRTIGAHVPLRFMAEAFGGEVGWDEDRGMAVVTINGRTQHIPNRGPETLVVNDRTMLHISSNLFSYFGLTVSVSEDGERITVTERFLEFNPINVSQIRDAARQSPFFSSRDGRTVVFVPSTNLLLPASFETDDRIYSYSVGFEAVEGFTLLRRGELVILSVTSRAKPSSIQNISGTFTGDELVARGHATRSMTIGDFQVLNLNANWRNIPLAEGSSTITVNGVRYNYYVTRLDSTTRIRTANAGDTIVLYMARYTTPPSQPSGGGGGSYRPPIVTPETTVSLNPRNVNLQSGHLAPAGSNTTSVRVTVSNNQGFSVHVQDPSVATAVRSGSNIHITWAGIGTTTYHVVSDDGRGIASGTITSSLNGDILVTGFNLDVTDMTLLIGQTQTANVIGRQPISATELINWSSSNSQVASVNSNGQITAHTAGNATITARTAVGGLTRTVSVTVVDGAIGAKMELAKIGNGFAGNRLEVPFGTNAANTAIVEALILAQAQNQVGSGYVVSMVSSNYDSTSLVWTGRFIVSQIGNAMNTATDVSNRNILINVAAGPNETDAEKELNGIEVSLPSEWEIPADSQLTDVAAIEAMVMQVANANVASGYSVSVETTQYIPPQSPGLWTGRLTITSVTNPADTATRIITIVVHYEVATKHTVTFVHTEGTLISGDLVQEVVEGQDAVPPVIERDGFTLSWDGVYTNITAPVTITAVWEAATSGTLCDVDIDGELCGGTKDEFGICDNDAKHPVPCPVEGCDKILVDGECPDHPSLPGGGGDNDGGPCGNPADNYACEDNGGRLDKDTGICDTCGWPDFITGSSAPFEPFSFGFIVFGGDVENDEVTSEMQGGTNTETSTEGEEVTDETKVEVGASGNDSGSEATDETKGGTSTETSGETDSGTSTETSGEGGELTGETEVETIVVDGEDEVDGTDGVEADGNVDGDKADGEGVEAETNSDETVIVENNETKTDDVVGNGEVNTDGIVDGDEDETGENGSDDNVVVVDSGGDSLEGSSGGESSDNSSNDADDSSGGDSINTSTELGDAA